jgi:hypothetical protein
MNDEYLWDKSGKPDPEMEKLEGLLGELRYRRPSTPLPLPQRAPVHTRRFFRPAYAAAAAILCAAVIASLWLGLGISNQSATAGLSAINAQPGRAQDWLSSGSISLAVAGRVQEEAARPAPPTTINRGVRSQGLKHRELPVSLSASNRRPQISEAEGVAAREQLIKALHLASSKLNLLQKKIQDNKSDGPNS